MYINYEKKNLEEQIKDLMQTIDINKQVIAECVTTKRDSEILKKLNEENRLLS